MSHSGPVQLALIADGPSDEALLQPLTWAFRSLAPNVALAPPRFYARRPPGRRLDELVSAVLAQDAPDLLFVHRDAEKGPLQTRKKEIPTGEKVVAVVPVRMTEAWLLIDEQAIRRAAGNPNGRTPLELPKVQRLEDLPDPKATLYELLVRASEHTGRRRQQFHRASAARLVAEYIDDFSLLRALPAFLEMERDLRTIWGV